ncbi:MAG: AI-2E family transporter [Nanoarchaeota archaeon]|nr:AI-2E family transporter [Nanoarchaeota archaeon]
MEAERRSKITFYLIMLLLAYLAFLLMKPYFSYVVFALLFSYMFNPLYKWLYKRTKKRDFSAATITIFIISILVIPTMLLMFSLINQTASTIQSISSGGSIYEELQIDIISEKLSDLFHKNIDLEVYLNLAVDKVGKFILEEKAPQIINHVAEIVLGIFIMFFVTFYLFRGGKLLYEEVKELIPLKRHYKVRLFTELENMLHAVIYGQVVTAIIQGCLCGLGLYVAGVPNVIFWTFVTIIIGFIPFVGTPLVFVPAAFYLIINDRVGAGVGLLIYGFIIVMNIDNVIKPKIIGGRAKVHPVLVLLGVIGGLKVFGIIGLLIGPIIMALFIIFLRIYSSDFMHDDRED